MRPTQGKRVMHLQWKPPLETAGATHHEAVDETTGITVVVECDHPGSPEPWVWYLTNYPVVSREPADNEGPAGRASTRDAAVEAATKSLPTLKESAHLKRQQKELYESEQ
jgi:hypothetical protein